MRRSHRQDMLKWCLILLALGLGAIAWLSRAETQRVAARWSGKTITANNPSPLVAQPRARPAHQTQLKTPAPTVTQVGTAADAPTQPVTVTRFQQLKRTPEESDVLWRAEEKLVTACMAARGHTYIPNPSDPATDDASEFARLHAGDVEAARAMGFGLSDEMEHGGIERSASDTNTDALSKMDETQRKAYEEALLGPPVDMQDLNMRSKVEVVPLPGGGEAYWFKDSCVAQARHFIYGDDYVHNELGFSRNELYDEARARMENTPDYQRGIKAFSNCMHDKGQRFSHPGEAADALSRDFKQGILNRNTLAERELAAAPIEAGCYRTAALDKLDETLGSDAERTVLEMHQSTATAMYSAQTAASARAESVLTTDAVFD